jgi:hypothetical protein
MPDRNDLDPARGIIYGCAFGLGLWLGIVAAILYR